MSDDTPQTAESQTCGERQSAFALGPILDTPLLGLLAEAVDDIEKVRCANENRLRTLTDTSEHGHGFDLGTDGISGLASTVAALKCDSPTLTKLGIEPPPKVRGRQCCLEHGAISNLQSQMRRHPLWAWAKPIQGVGEKQFARLLSVIGDPYWKTVIDTGGEVVYDGPRRVSDLRSYCGWGDAKQQRRVRGRKCNWSGEARKRVWLIATSCVKQKKGTRYRDVYDAARKKYADAVHTDVCVQCGPAGKPAQPGSPLSLGHQHARGIRAIAKELLKDLWVESRRLHLAAELEAAA